MAALTLLTVFIVIILPALIKSDFYPCVQRETTYGNVCVCNSTYCDTIPAVLNLTNGEYQWYTTNADQLGFNSTTGNFSNPSSAISNATVTVKNLNATRQTILGFGGAFTDATGINVINLSKATQQNWLESHFGEEGIQYSFGRVPVAGTDFSVRWYTYCDEKDDTLEKFSLQSEDLLYKIPLIQKAIELRGNGSLNLFASAWSAPLWMKTNQTYSGITAVEDEYLDLWAQYYLKFFNAYYQYNISFWGVTTQNEPIDGLYGTAIPNNGFNSTKMAKWIKESLGPTVRNSSFADIKIILHDDQRTLLPALYEIILADEDVINFADGIAVHWYYDSLTAPEFLNWATNNVANSTKNLFRLGTEASEGFLYDPVLDTNAVKLGSWLRADSYLNNIIEDLSYDFIGWVDWNMALNTTGGGIILSTGDYVDVTGLDAATIVNATSDEFYKQPMFYVLGHFSKFIVPGSQRIDSTTVGTGVSSISFLRPDGKVAVVIRNRLRISQTVTLEIAEQTEVFNISAQSINTILYSV